MVTFVFINQPVYRSRTLTFLGINFFELKLGQDRFCGYRLQSSGKLCTIMKLLKIFTGLMNRFLLINRTCKLYVLGRLTMIIRFKICQTSSSKLFQGQM